MDFSLTKSSSGPCYDQPLCDASIVDGVAQGNNIHIAIQTPAVRSDDDVPSLEQMC